MSQFTLPFFFAAAAALVLFGTGLVTGLAIQRARMARTHSERADLHSSDCTTPNTL
jgi:hypothetical protein